MPAIKKSRIDRIVDRQEAKTKKKENKEINKKKKHKKSGNDEETPKWLIILLSCLRIISYIKPSY